MVEPTQLKNMSQNGNLPQVGVKKKTTLKPPPSQQLQATRFTPTNSQENAKEPNQPARCLLGSTRLGKAAPMEPSLLDDMPFISGVLDDRREVELYFWDLYIWYIGSYSYIYIYSTSPKYGMDVQDYQNSKELPFPNHHCFYPCEISRVCIWMHIYIYLYIRIVTVYYVKHLMLTYLMRRFLYQTSF